MRTLKITLAAAAASFCFAGAAQAQDDASPSFSFNIGALSDYVYRGFSQTDEDPAIQGGVDFASGMFYAGAWASNVDFGDSTDAEYNFYAGVTPTLGAVSFDIGVIYYGYIDAPSGSGYAFWEGKVAASVPAGPATLGAAIHYSPEFYGKTGDAWYYEANAEIAIPDTSFTVSGAVGRQTIDAGGSYTTWNAGVGVALTDTVGLDLRYWDTNVSKTASGGLADARVVASILLSW